MADIAYRETNIVAPRARTDWGAIWSGVFCFMAIWAVFGALGFAIFASISNPNAAQPILSNNIGIYVWITVLTIIAMYVAGRETGYLAGVTNRHNGLVHGLVMFGLSIVGLILLVSLGGSALSGGTGANVSAHNPYIVTVFANIGWVGFVALFLSWLAAMFGASQGVARKVEPQRDVREIRPAA